MIWHKHYEKAITNLLEQMTRFHEYNASNQSRSILEVPYSKLRILFLSHSNWMMCVTQTLKRHYPELKDSASVSPVALNIAFSSGIDCVLVGIRKKSHVEDIQRALCRGPRSETELLSLLRAIYEDSQQQQQQQQQQQK